jgi:hypothetical protein
VGTDAGEVLCARRKIKLSGDGLRDYAAGAAAVCGAALSELVSASSFEAGKLEGQKLWGLSSPVEWIGAVDFCVFRIETWGAHISLNKGSKWFS